MTEAFESMHALVVGGTKMDVPVPACLNHCINQEVFVCKICGEIFDNIHKYITHGKSHRGTSSVCSWCGRVWPSYSALCIHQLVWEDKKSNLGEPEDCAETKKVSKGTSKLVSCPLTCGLEPLSPSEIKSHLSAFHGAKQERIMTIEKAGEVSIQVDLGSDSATCPKCATKLSKVQVGLENHIAFQCMKRSTAVRERVQELQNQSSAAGEDPSTLLLQEIHALILHLKGLLEKGAYREIFEQEGKNADLKYSRLPSSFTKEYLCWVPIGYTLQVLESEEDNFAVIFDVWSQVVDRLASPPNLKDVCMRLERELSGNLTSGLVPRWPSLNFDPAMLESPDQDVLSKLEAELGWVK